jgi:hypothetical protein
MVKPDPYFRKKVRQISIVILGRAARAIREPSKRTALGPWVFASLRPRTTIMAHDSTPYRLASEMNFGLR